MGSIRRTRTTIQVPGSPAQPVSRAGTVELASDGADLLLSRNGGPYTPIAVVGAPSGWTDLGAVVALTTATDQVGIGTAAPDPGAKLEVRASAAAAFDEATLVVRGLGEADESAELRLVRVPVAGAAAGDSIGALDVELEGLAADDGTATFRAVRVETARTGSTARMVAMVLDPDTTGGAPLDAAILGRSCPVGIGTEAHPVVVPGVGDLDIVLLPGFSAGAGIYGSVVIEHASPAGTPLVLSAALLQAADLMRVEDQASQVSWVFGPDGFPVSVPQAGVAGTPSTPYRWRCVATGPTIADLNVHAEADLLGGRRRLVLDDELAVQAAAAFEFVGGVGSVWQFNNLSLSLRDRNDTAYFTITPGANAILENCLEVISRQPFRLAASAAGAGSSSRHERFECQVVGPAARWLNVYAEGEALTSRRRLVVDDDSAAERAASFEFLAGVGSVVALNDAGWSIRNESDVEQVAFVPGAALTIRNVTEIVSEQPIRLPSTDPLTPGAKSQTFAWETTVNGPGLATMVGEAASFGAIPIWQIRDESELLYSFAVLATGPQSAIWSCPQTMQLVDTGAVNTYLSVDGTGATAALSFYGAPVTTQQTVVGVKLPGDVVMAALLTALANLGLIVDATT